MAIKSKELSGDLRAGVAVTLRDDLAAALGKGDLRVKTAGLTGVDAAIVQVLISAKATASQMDRKLQIDIPADGVLAALLARMAIDSAQLA